MNRRASVLHIVLIHIAIVAMLFVFFFFAMESKLGSRGVKQQVLEKELALLIGASEKGFSFEVKKENVNGVVDSVEVRDSRIFVSVDGLPSIEGYLYYSSFEVEVEEREESFLIRILS